MILAELRRGLARKAKEWSEKNAVVLPATQALNPPPAHVDADVSVPWPLAAAKASGKNPLIVAEGMAEVFSGLPEIESAAAVPPGFINLKLKTASLGANLKALTLAPQRYGRDPDLKKRRILLEFVSANPTGPLHMASGRGATLGDSLARVLRRLGHEVRTEYYVNNAGGRVELLGQSVRAVHEGTPVPEKGYHGEYLKDVAAGAPKEASGWSDAQWGQYAMDLLLNSHKEDMEKFDTHFDRWYLESELFESSAVEKTLAFLKERGMVFEKENAIWLGTARAEGSEDDKDRVLVKSNGKPTYFLPDIAYHKDKFDRGHDLLIDIWGADHHGYVPRMKAAIAALGRPPESFAPIVHQLIHLFRGKEAVKMSKRAGTFIPLREIMDEVGKDACRFFFALRTPNSHLNFDLELAKKQSSDNPVYYCQYVHARICSIFHEADKQGILKKGEPLPDLNARLLTQKEERALIVKIAWLPEVLKAVERELSPHPLANYALELAGLFHPFYEKCRVVDPAEPELSKARLLLCAGARDAIAQSLHLLGVSSPEEM